MGSTHPSIGLYPMERGKELGHDVDPDRSSGNGNDHLAYH